MKKTTMFGAVIAALVLFVIAMVLYGVPSAFATQRFENENVNITTKLPPQYLGWKVAVGSTTQNVPFYYKVSANVRGVGETVASPVTTAYATYGPTSSTNSLRMMWGAVDDATEYYLYKSVDNSAFYLLATVTAPTLTYIDAGAALGSAYSTPTPPGGNLSVEGTITTKNLTVTGTLSPYTTGTFTGENISLDYGISAATGVFSGAVNIQGAATLDSTLDVDGNEYHGAANYRSTFTAASGAQVWTGGLSTLSTLNADGAATLNSTLDVDGNEYHGAANYRSTFTAASGAYAITGAVTSLAGITGRSITATLAAMKAAPYTRAEICALDPVTAGEFYFCSDCTGGNGTVDFMVSSGTAVNQYQLFSDASKGCE